MDTGRENIPIKLSSFLISQRKKQSDTYKLAIDKSCLYIFIFIFLLISLILLYPIKSIADKNGFPHGIVAFANFDSDKIEELLEFHSQFKNVRGIR